jgi:hypothetical protein
VREIHSGLLLVAKALLFALVAITAGALLLAKTPELSTFCLLVLCVWASARLYYFAFYVIENYIDAGFKYSGVGSAVLFLVRRSRARMQLDAASRNR